MIERAPRSGVWYAQDLTERVRRRNEDACTELYQRYYQRIHQYLVHRLNGDIHEAEDLAAEVFARAFAKIEDYQVGSAPFASWLFRIAHNQLIDHLRRRQRRPTVALEAFQEVEQIPAAPDPDYGLVRGELGRALAHLTKEQRHVLLLRFFQGLSTFETAEAVGKSEDAAKKLQARGLGALKRELDCPSGCWRVPLT